MIDDFGATTAPHASPLDLVGVLGRERYDELVPVAWRASALLPTARSALLLGNGGPAFFRAYRAQADSFAHEPDPLDAFTKQIATLAARDLTEAGFESQAFFYFEKRAGAYVDFRALGEASGLGAPSRLGILLHPVFGPWMALRALLLTEKVLNPTALPDDFAPCRGCPAPCAVACPAAALSVECEVREAFDLQRCHTRRTDTEDCVSMCSARRACVVGPEWAYDGDAEAFHLAASLWPTESTK